MEKKHILITLLVLILGIQRSAAQVETINEHKLIKYEDEWFELIASFDIPSQEKALQDTCSSSIFYEIFGDMYEKELKGKTFLETYQFFLRQVKEYPLDKIKKAEGKKIIMQIKRGNALNGKYACYSITYKGYIGLMNPYRKKIIDNKERIHKLFLGSDYSDDTRLIKDELDVYLIYDEQQRRVLLLADVLVPEYSEKVKKMIGGESVDMLIDDNKFMFITDNGIGQLEYSDITKNYFTKYFKLLVGWEQE